ncbi:Uncharacterized protein TPAR_01970 [Tolypocladium paradoxum]|uniref:MARVEL domain-containing protein n=1 Tax=Tolypocladium paradoxum TaxID=94208 RepID=A0A2S4L5Z8_9HYPO|nr:Uncharacterized protein TPAR_01970 [Tolypocladium paradoxum]
MEQTHEKVASDHVLKTPIWVFAIRIAQVVLSLIILGLAADIAHDLYLDELGLAIAVSVLTWVIVAYALTTEKVSAWHAGYHIIAVLALDAFLVVLWLAAWAAAAAKRAMFKVPVTVSQCFDNGGAFNSKNCVFKRAIPLLFKKGMDEMSAIAGLGALVWILFIATFVWTLLQFLGGRKQGRFPINMGTTTTTTDNHQMEPKVEQQQPLQPQATGQYQQQPLAQHPPQPAQSPYEQQPPYSPPPQGTYSPPPQDQQAYAQYPPQQYPPQQYQQPQGGELPGHQQQQYVPPATSSPPPQQPYHQQ